MNEWEDNRRRTWGAPALWLVLAGVLSAVAGCAGADNSAEPAASGEPLRLEIAPYIGGGPHPRGR